MTRNLAKGLAGAAGLLGAALLAMPAQAQNVSNEVWLGQNGLTNEVEIDQTGRGNSAGADNVALRLNQFGEVNTLTIDQFGWDNKVGTALFDQAPQGVNQNGDRNVIDVTQQNFVQGGFNVVGAILQVSPLGGDISTIANGLTVIQHGFGAAGHRVGTVSQENTLDGGPANTATIEQYGGGQDAGNRLDGLAQQGSGNRFGLMQSGRSNLVGTALQQGTDNRTQLTQRDGDDNRVEFSEQYGALNAIDARATGSRNSLVRLYQDNADWQGAAVGNRIVVTIKGDDNGGTGIDGGPGEFAAQAALDVGIAQAELFQIGDDNDIGLSINEGNENRFGARQEGDDNEATIAVASLAGQSSDANEIAVASLAGQSSDANEIAIRQLGDSNVATVDVSGDGNVAAVVQDGDENQIFIDQQGTQNLVKARITGSSNNAVGALFRGSAALVASGAMSGPLTPGAFVQDGAGNRATLEVAGSRNDAAAEQTGAGHIIEATMVEDGNALAVVQGGNANTSLSFQSGTANTLGVRQF